MGKGDWLPGQGGTVFLGSTDPNRDLLPRRFIVLAYWLSAEWARRHARRRLLRKIRDSVNMQTAKGKVTNMITRLTIAHMMRKMSSTMLAALGMLDY